MKCMSTLTIKDIRDFLSDMRVIAIYINGKLVWDDANMSIEESKTKFEIITNDCTKNIKTIKLNVVDFHHTICRIKTINK